MHPERGRASVGSLFTLEIPVNNEGLEASSFREKRFGLEVSGWIGNSQTTTPFPETLMHGTGLSDLLIEN